MPPKAKAEGTRKSTRAVPEKKKDAPEPSVAPPPKKAAAATKRRGAKAPPAVLFPNLPPAERSSSTSEAVDEPPAKKTAAPKAKATVKDKAPAAKKTATKKAAAAAPKETPAKKAAAAPKEAPVKKAAAAPKEESAKKATGRRKALKDDGEEPAEKAKVVKKATAAPKPKPVKKAAGKAQKETSEAPQGKRKAPEDEEEEHVAKRAKSTTGKAVKKPKVAAAPKPKPFKALKVINETPNERLHVYVFGENSAGELGLGHLNRDGKRVTDVKRPRLNPLLDAKTVGVVAIATGGMHCVAITHDSKILTWGVNDQGALGRDTPKQTDEGDGSDDDEEDSGLNPLESTPMEVDPKYFPEGTKFVQAVASDSASFVLTGDGFVYGWGTFRGNEGIIGFSPTTEIAYYPTKIEPLKQVKQIAAGANHIMALTHSGATYGWGASEQSQLGRRTVERTKAVALVPREFGLPNKRKNHIVDLSCGSYHTFAIDNSGNVWSWGLNNFAETGIAEGAGDDDAYVNKPTIVESLSGYNIKVIKGGGHHSVACTTDGKLLTWGRIDGHQVGIATDKLPPSAVIQDARGEARILKIPSIIPDIHAVYVTAASDTSMAIDKDGKAYSWGFSTNYQTGQGVLEDIKVATLIDNTAIRDVKLEWAGLGGQFGVLTAVADMPDASVHVNGEGEGSGD